jgi:membrane-associated phospholipid phosphatase
MRFKDLKYPFIFGSVFILITLALLLSDRTDLINRSFGADIFQNQFLPLQFWQAISFLGDLKTIVVCTLIVSAIFWFLKDKKKAIFFASVQLGANLFKILITIIIANPRPDWNFVSCNSFSLASFPSGHTFAVLVFFGTIYLMFKKKNIWLAMIAAISTILVGISRISLGCHWPLDIVGSFALGLFVLSIIPNLTKRYSISR